MFCFVLIESPPSGRIHILYANLTDWSVLYICSTQQKWKVARCLTPEHLLFSVSEKKKTTTKKHFDQNSLQSAFMMMNVSHSGKHSRKANSSPGNGKVVKGSLFFCGGLPMFKNLHLHANLGQGMIACCKPIFSMCFRVFTYVYRWLLWLFQCSNTVREIHCSLHNSS